MIDSNAKEKKPTESVKTPLNKSATVGIPVMVTIIVPISVPLPTTVYENPACKLHGDTVVNAEDNKEAFEAAMEIAAKSPTIQEAITKLLSAAGLYKYNHPEAKIFYSPCAGVITEEEI